jgi:predicted PurR-regulated permease PerM
MEEAAQPRLNLKPETWQDDTAQPTGPAPFAERRGAADGRRIRPPTTRVALLLFAAIVVAFVLYLGRDVLSPFVVGLLMVYLLDPAVERLGRLRIPRALAILLVYVVVVALIAELVALTVPPLVEQIGQFFGNTPKLAALIQEQVERIRDGYLQLDIPPEVRAAIDRTLARMGQDAGSINPGVVLPVFNSLAGLIASLVGYVIIPVWVFYLLKDRPTLTVAFDRSLPSEWRDDTWAIIRIAERVFGQWVRGQLLLGTTVGLATFAGMELLGQTVDPVFGRFALLLAILAGLLELLPIIGPIIAAVPAILLGATAGLQATIAAFILTFAIQQLENYLLVPKIQGDAVKLHPSAVMFALIVGGAIGGLLGAILALPITATGRDIYRYLFRRLSPPTADMASQSPDEAFAAAVGEEPPPLGTVEATAPLRMAHASPISSPVTSPVEQDATEAVQPAPSPRAGQSSAEHAQRSDARVRNSERPVEESR